MKYVQLDVHQCHSADLHTVGDIEINIGDSGNDDCDSNVAIRSIHDSESEKQVMMTKGGVIL